MKICCSFLFSLVTAVRTIKYQDCKLLFNADVLVINYSCYYKNSHQHLKSVLPLSLYSHTNYNLHTNGLHSDVSFPACFILSKCTVLLFLFAVKLQISETMNLTKRKKQKRKTLSIEVKTREVVASVCTDVH